MRELNRCPYEDDEHMQCEWCSYDKEWVKSEFDDNEEFDELYDFE